MLGHFEALAQAPAPTFQTEADQAILVDAESGAVLFEKDADKQFAPASMAKVMTLAILFKKLKAGEITPETEFPVSQYAWRTGGAPSRTSAMFAPLNSTVKVSDLLLGIAVQNANDGCIVVAEGLAGTDDAFATLMNEEARAIGLTQTNFANSTGLPNPGNLSTARDLAKLALYVIREYPEYYKSFGQREFKYRSYNFRTFNPLMDSNVGVDGLKAGFTEDVGFGMLASAVRDGRRLVMVMNGLEKERERKDESVRFISWGFANFRAFRVFDRGETVGDAWVWGSQKWRVPLKAKTDIKILMPINSKDQRIRAQIIYKGPLKFPVKEGDQVASVKITSEAGTSNTAPLYAAETVEEGGIMHKGIGSIFFRALGSVL